MRPIGGYFELELPMYDNMPNSHAVKVNSGRHALEYILRVIGVGNIRHLYVPRYTCDVVLEPIRRLGIFNYSLYDVDDNLEVRDMPDLSTGDYIIINNYFGIKDAYIRRISRELKEHVIIDNSQALYYPVELGVRSFYSPRKFVGVPDGGLANAVGGIDVELEDRDLSYDRCSHLLKRIDVDSMFGYPDFKENSAKLKGLPLRRMSKLTERLLQSIDFMTVRGDRKGNYSLLRDSLEGSNLLTTPESGSLSCPMVYPYRTKDAGLRQRLIDNDVFVARYWPDVSCGNTPTSNAVDLATEILPLPIDQRYGTEDMKRIIEIINSL